MLVQPRGACCVHVGVRDAAATSLRLTSHSRICSAATFVDIVKFAVRGLPRQRSHALAKDFLELRKAASERLRRAACVCVLLVRCSPWRACAAPRPRAYALLGREAPDFALQAVVGQQRAPVRASRRSRGAELLGQPLRAVRRAARCAGSQSRDLRSAGLQVFGIGVDDDQARALEFARAQSVAFRCCSIRRRREPRVTRWTICR